MAAVTPDDYARAHSRSATWLTRYDAMSTAAASTVISEYSTSFSLATSVLPRQERRDIRNLYAVVRIADEIVDGTARAAGAEDIGRLLTAYEEQVLAAPSSRFHTDPVLHAYAETARRCQFDPDHMRAFFASMRRDLNQHEYTAAEFDEYVYGSAEVIGLLCLSVFLADTDASPADRETMNASATALGAAFQKVNFLRDLAEDSIDLGRRYFPQLAGSELDDALKAELVADIRANLNAALSGIALLPLRVRAGVLSAHGFFTELTDRIAATPAADLLTRRISVPRHRKAVITACAIAQAPRFSARLSTPTTPKDPHA